jgi:CBS domain-containing protein
MEKIMSTNLTVESKMLELGKFPVLSGQDILKRALDEMTKFRLGIACFTNKEGKLLGILTDGDLRRLLLTHQSPLPALLVTAALEFGTSSPFSIDSNMNSAEAVKIMHDKQIWDLPVVKPNNILVGLIHRHDLN